MKSLVVVFVLLALAGVHPLSMQSATVDQGPGRAAQVSSTPITVGETLRIKSKRLGEEREIRVYLPPSYASSKQRYPVIYTLDGETIGPATASAVHFMTGASEIPQMPEALVVAVLNTDRNRDMPIPWEYGKGSEENFLAFLADELIPMIEQRYRTQPLRVLIGHSQGGLFAHYALTARPTVFQWYVPMDAPLFGPVRPILEKVRTLITKDSQYRGRLVTVEGAFGWGKKDWPSLIEAAPKGFYGARVEIADETHETMVYKGIYEGLKRLFHDFAPEIKDAKLAELEAKYKALSEAYGYQLDIPQQVLLRSATRNAMQQNGAEAIKLVQRAVAIYGESPVTKRIITQAEEALKKGADPRVAEILNSPPPGVERMKPFLGTWAGRMDVPDGVPLDIVVTFEVEGDVVRVREKVSGPDGKPFLVRNTFLRALDDKTVQWGGPNGRTGLNLTTARLVDENTLKGKQETVGVNRPSGMTVPADPTFTYKRRPQ